VGSRRLEAMDSLKWGEMVAALGSGGGRVEECAFGRFEGGAWFGDSSTFGGGVAAAEFVASEGRRDLPSVEAA